MCVRQAFMPGKTGREHRNSTCQNCSRGLATANPFFSVDKLCSDLSLLLAMRANHRGIYFAMFFFEQIGFSFYRGHLREPFLLSYEPGNAHDGENGGDYEQRR